MDDLRIALLIAGLAVVAGVYALARFSRRRAARRAAELGPGALDSHDGYGHDPDWSVPPVSGSAVEDAGAEAEIDRLGGVFAPRREVSDAEISVDVSILAGLRATYESTMDGTLDGTVEESIAPEPSVDDGAPAPLAHAVAAQPGADGVAAQPGADGDAAQPGARSQARCRAADCRAVSRSTCRARSSISPWSRSRSW